MLQKNQEQSNREIKMHMIEQLDRQAINLNQAQFSKTYRKKARTSRRDFFENKPLRPNIFQQRIQEYQSPGPHIPLQSNKQSVSFLQSSQKVLPNMQTEQKNVIMYRRSHRRNKTATNTHKQPNSPLLHDKKSKSIAKNQKASPQIHQETNNFIFEESEDEKNNQVEEEVDKGVNFMVSENIFNEISEEEQPIFEMHSNRMKEVKTERKSELFGNKEKEQNLFNSIKRTQNRRRKMFENFKEELQSQEKETLPKNKSLSIRPRRKYRRLDRTESIQSNASISIPTPNQSLTNISVKFLPEEKSPHESPPHSKEQEKKQIRIPRNRTSIRRLISSFRQMKIIREKKWSKEKYQLYSIDTKEFMFCAYVQSRDEIYIYDRNVDYHEGDPYILKMQSNFMGTLINIFTYGLTQKESKSLGQQYKTRQLYATIETESSSILDQVRPRQFHAYFYNSKVDLKTLPPQIRQTPLSKLYIQSDHYKKYITCFQNKKPKWDERQKVHILDMYNRADEASVKNFILLDENKIECIIFGKVSKDIFNLDCQQDFPPILAFAFSLSSFLYRSW